MIRSVGLVIGALVMLVWVFGDKLKGSTAKHTGHVVVKTIEDEEVLNTAFERAKTFVEELLRDPRTRENFRVLIVDTLRDPHVVDATKVLGGDLVDFLLTDDDMSKLTVRWVQRLLNEEHVKQSLSELFAEVIQRDNVVASAQVLVNDVLGEYSTASAHVPGQTAGS